LGEAAVSYLFGDVGDVPFVGDFDGDDIDTFGVYRRGGIAHLRNQHSAGPADVVFSYGERGDTAMAGAWAAGADTVALWRSSEGTFHLRHQNASGSADEQIEYGYRVHVPVVGRFGNLPGGDEPPPGEPPYPDVGSGRRIIYSNSLQQLWLIDENEEVVKTHLVSGRVGIPGPGTYSVFSKSVQAYAPYGGITMTHMVRFARGVRWPYGFHSIPIYPDGRPLQTEDQLGTFRSGGCVRQKNSDAVFVFNWADIGTTVHVTP
jgi:lipoprotein-anchoring transpeptidase ErfK/SrfK